MLIDERSLGELRRTFKPKLANLVGGGVLGLGTTTLGIAWLYSLLRPEGRPAPNDHHVFFYWVLVVMGFGILVVGIGLLVWTVRHVRHQVSIYQHGFTYGPATDPEVCRWSDVAIVREVFDHEELQLLRVPDGAIRTTARSFEVERQDGRTFRFTAKTVDGIFILGEHLRAARSEHAFAWEEVESTRRLRL